MEPISWILIIKHVLPQMSLGCDTLLQHVQLETMADTQNPLPPDSKLVWIYNLYNYNLNI